MIDFSLISSRLHACPERHTCGDAMAKGTVIDVVAALSGSGF
jgi:hypothetical protein